MIEPKSEKSSPLKAWNDPKEVEAEPAKDGENPQAKYYERITKDGAPRGHAQHIHKSTRALNPLACSPVIKIIIDTS